MSNSQTGHQPGATAASAAIPSSERPGLAKAAYPLSSRAYLELLQPIDVPSLEACRELLDAAFVSVVSDLGCPGNAAAEQVFNDAVDARYRQSLLWRRPMRPRSFDWRLRAALMTSRGVR